MTCCNKDRKENLHEEAHGIELSVSDYLEREKRNLNQLKELRAEATKLGDSIKELEGLIDDIPGDSLKLIFEKQKQLRDYVSESKPNSYYHHGKERYPYERVKLNCDCIIHEAIELVNGTEWKWWKDYDDTDLDLVVKTEMPLDEEDSEFMEKALQDNYQDNFLTDEQRATQKQILENSKLEYIQKELIDIAHFLFQACLETGMTSKQFLEMYLDKNKVNHERQDDGY